MVDHWESWNFYSCALSPQDLSLHGTSVPSNFHPLEQREVKHTPWLHLIGDGLTVQRFRTDYHVFNCIQFWSTVQLCYFVIKVNRNDDEEVTNSYRICHIALY